MVSHLPSAGTTIQTPKLLTTNAGSADQIEAFIQLSPFGRLARLCQDASESHDHILDSH